MHPSRRRQALRRVEAAEPQRVLVMCLGNICRSPFAAGVLARDLPGREVRSAGFLESGRPAPREAVSVGAEYGVNLTTHRSMQVSPEAITWADLVLVMDGRQAARVESISAAGTLIERLGDFDPGPIDTRTVIDPIERDRAFFAQVYDRIEACCETVAHAARHEPEDGS